MVSKSLPSGGACIPNSSPLVAGIMIVPHSQETMLRFLVVDSTILFVCVGPLVRASGFGLLTLYARQENSRNQAL